MGGAAAAAASLLEMSRSSLASSAALSLEEEDAREDEAVLHEWAPGRLYEWLVSIDLEVYADSLQTRSIAGSSARQHSLRHSPASRAAANLSEATTSELLCSLSRARSQ